MVSGPPLLALHGGGLFRIIFRIVVVRFFFHTLGFVGGIAVLLALLLGVYLWRRSRRNGGRIGPWG